MPLSTQQLIQFLTASFLMTIAPGPDVMATLSLGLSKGWRIAVCFGIGCGLGCLFHTSLAVLGVTAVIKSSATAYSLLKYCGAGYLLWLGIGLLRTSAGTAASEGAKTVSGNSTAELSARGYFLKGLLANAVNPKVALFFTAFLPPFVNESAGNEEWQLALLGLVFTCQAVVIFGLLGFFSGRISEGLRSHPRAVWWLDRMTGMVFLWLSLLMLIPER